MRSRSSHEGYPHLCRRTFVMAKKMSEQSYQTFKERHHAASVQLEGRNEAMSAVVAES